MTHEDLSEQLSVELEQEYSSRVEEIQKIENFVGLNLNDDSDMAGLMRKSLVLILYAHFEGYCKQALQYYIIYINKEDIPICNVKAGLVAANLNVEFQKLFNTNYHPVTLTSLATDAALQQHGRKREFISAYDNCINRQIGLKEDFISTESNLRPDILKKLLFQLELDSSAVDTYQGEIHRLVNVRNGFAHGERMTYPNKKEFDQYKEAAYSTMTNIKLLVAEAFAQSAYLKAI